jgi:hypothetical protein
MAETLLVMWHKHMQVDPVLLSHRKENNGENGI